MGAIWHPGQRSVLLAGPKEDPATHVIPLSAYGPGIVDTPMWDHIDRELAKIVRHTIKLSCRTVAY